MKTNQNLIRRLGGSMKLNTWTEANTIARKLWIKWVSGRPAVGHDGYLVVDTDPTHYKFYDLAYIHKCMLDDYRATVKNPSRMSLAAFKEVKGELILLGKVSKTLGYPLGRRACEYGNAEIRWPDGLQHY